MREVTQPQRVTCSQCYYGRKALAGPTAQAQTGLLCHRNPPIPAAIASPTQMGMQVQVITLYPAVQESNWCGEARAAIAPTPAN